MHLDFDPETSSDNLYTSHSLSIEAIFNLIQRHRFDMVELEVLSIGSRPSLSRFKFFLKFEVIVQYGSKYEKNCILNSSRLPLQMQFTLKEWLLGWPSTLPFNVKKSHGRGWVMLCPPSKEVPP